jgi:hypothetical protein
VGDSVVEVTQFLGQGVELRAKARAQPVVGRFEDLGQNVGWGELANPSISLPYGAGDAGVRPSPQPTANTFTISGLGNQENQGNQCSSPVRVARTARNQSSPSGLMSS